MTDVLTATIPVHDSASSKDVSEATASQILKANEEADGNIVHKEDSLSLDANEVTCARDHEDEENPSSKNDSESVSAITSDINEKKDLSADSDAPKPAAEPDDREEDKRELVSPDANTVQESESGGPMAESNETLGSGLDETVTTIEEATPGSNSTSDVVPSESTEQLSNSLASHQSFTNEETRTADSTAPADVERGEQTGIDVSKEDSKDQEEPHQPLREVSSTEPPNVVGAKLEEKSVELSKEEDEHSRELEEPTERPAEISELATTNDNDKGADENLAPDIPVAVEEQNNNEPAIPENVETEKNDVPQETKEPEIESQVSTNETDTTAQSDALTSSDEKTEKSPSNIDDDHAEPGDQSVEEHLPAASEPLPSEISRETETVDEAAATGATVDEPEKANEEPAPESTSSAAHDTRPESGVPLSNEGSSDTPTDPHSTTDPSVVEPGDAGVGLDHERSAEAQNDSEMTNNTVDANSEREVTDSVDAGAEALGSAESIQSPLVTQVDTKDNVVEKSDKPEEESVGEISEVTGEGSAGADEMGTPSTGLDHVEATSNKDEKRQDETEVVAAALSSEQAIAEVVVETKDERDNVTGDDAVEESSGEQDESVAAASSAVQGDVTAEPCVEEVQPTDDAKSNVVVESGEKTLRSDVDAPPAEEQSVPAAPEAEPAEGAVEVEETTIDASTMAEPTEHVKTLDSTLVELEADPSSTEAILDVATEGASVPPVEDHASQLPSKSLVEESEPATEVKPTTLETVPESSIAGEAIEREEPSEVDKSESGDVKHSDEPASQAVSSPDKTEGPETPAISSADANSSQGAEVSPSADEAQELGAAEVKVTDAPSADNSVEPSLADGGEDAVTEPRPNEVPNAADDSTEPVEGDNISPSDDAVDKPSTVDKGETATETVVEPPAIEASDVEDTAVPPQIIEQSAGEAKEDDSALVSSNERLGEEQAEEANPSESERLAESETGMKIRRVDEGDQYDDLTDTISEHSASTAYLAEERVYENQSDAGEESVANETEETSFGQRTPVLLPVPPPETFDHQHVVNPPDETAEKLPSTKSGVDEQKSGEQPLDEEGHSLESGVLANPVANIENLTIDPKIESAVSENVPVEAQTAPNIRHLDESLAQEKPVEDGNSIEEDRLINQDEQPSTTISEVAEDAATASQSAGDDVVPSDAPKDVAAQASHEDRQINDLEATGVEENIPLPVIPPQHADASELQTKPNDEITVLVEFAEDEAQSSASGVDGQDETDAQSVLSEGIAPSSRGPLTEAESETVVVPSEAASDLDDQSTVHGGEVDQVTSKEQVECNGYEDPHSVEVVKEVLSVAGAEPILSSTSNEATEAVTEEVEKDPASSQSHAVAEGETVTPVMSARQIPSAETHDTKSVGNTVGDDLTSSIAQQDLAPIAEVPSNIVSSEEMSPTPSDNATGIAQDFVGSEGSESPEAAESTAAQPTESEVVEEVGDEMTESVTQPDELHAHEHRDLPSDAESVESPQSNAEDEMSSLTDSVNDSELNADVDIVASTDSASSEGDISSRHGAGSIEDAVVPDTADVENFAECTKASQSVDDASIGGDIVVLSPSIESTHSILTTPNNDVDATVDVTSIESTMSPQENREIKETTDTSIPEDVIGDDQIPPPYEEVSIVVEEEAGHFVGRVESEEPPSESPAMLDETASEDVVREAAANAQSQEAKMLVSETGVHPPQAVESVASEVEITNRGLSRMASSDTVTDMRPPLESTNEDLEDLTAQPFPSSYSVTHIGPRVVEGESQHPLPNLPETFSDALTKSLQDLDSTLDSTKASEQVISEDTAIGGDDEIYPDESISEVDAAEAKSDAPEPSMTPRSDLGIFTPSFDTRSEVSVASHKPLAPSSPRLDPEAPLPEVLQKPLVIPPSTLQQISAQASSGSEAFDLLTPLPVSMADDESKKLAGEDVPTDTAADTTLRREDDTDKDEVVSVASADDSILRGMEALNSNLNDEPPHAVEEVDNLSGLDTEVGDEPSLVGAESEDNLADVESLAPASTASIASEAWTESTGAGRLTTHGSFMDESMSMSGTIILPPDNIFTMVSGGEVPAVIRRSRSDEDLTMAQPALSPADQMSLNVSESDFEPLTDASLTSSRRIDGISELDSIQESSTLASRPDVDDLPEIPSSTTSLAIPEPDDADDTVILDSLPSSVDTSLSMEEQRAGYVSISSRATREDLPQYNSQTNILEMPNPNASYASDASALVGADAKSIEPAEEETVGHLSNGTATPLASMREGLSATPRWKELSSSSEAIDQVAGLTTFPPIALPQMQDRQGEDGSSLDDTTDFEPIPTPQFARKRLESTTSSKFPGSWVGTTPTIPQRPSLDIAQGEFSRPHMDGSAQGSVLGTPTATPTDGEEEKKGRCIIM